MCVVSVVSDYYTRTWPERFPNKPDVIQVLDLETKEMLRKALEMLDQIDKRLKDVECKDEQKEKFIAALNSK